MTRQRASQIARRAEGRCELCGRQPLAISQTTGQAASRCAPCLERQRQKSAKHYAKAHPGALKRGDALRSAFHGGRAITRKAETRSSHELPWWFNTETFYTEAAKRFPHTGQQVPMSTRLWNPAKGRRQA
jgi:hypothetical protein